MSLFMETLLIHVTKSLILTLRILFRIVLIPVSACCAVHRMVAMCNDYKGDTCWPDMMLEYLILRICNECKKSWANSKREAIANRKAREPKVYRKPIEEINEEDGN